MFVSLQIFFLFQVLLTKTLFLGSFLTKTTKRGSFPPKNLWKTLCRGLTCPIPFFLKKGREGIPVLGTCPYVFGQFSNLSRRNRLGHGNKPAFFCKLSKPSGKPCIPSKIVIIFIQFSTVFNRLLQL